MNISHTNRIWYIVGLMMILSISTVYAADGTTTETLTDMIFNILGSLLNLLYLITLPVLVIAGKAMDNSMVYGEFINLDKPLYMLWNLCRTFANFAIGGVILRKIIKYIFTDWSGKSPDFLKKTIMSAVAIVLGINFSWFIIGALLDISTILTYSLGAMPLSILKETNSKDMPILSVSSYFDYQSENEKKEKGPTKYLKPYTYYQWGSINIPQCINGEGGENKNQTLYKGLVVGPEYFPNIPNKNTVSFNNFDKGPQYCAINSQTLADITLLEKWKDENFIADGTKIADNNDKNNLMRQVIDHIITSTDGCNTELILKETITNNTNTAIEKEIKIGSDKLKSLKDSLVIGDGQISSFVFCKNGDISPLETKNNAYNINTRQKDFVTPGNTYGDQGGLTMNTLINKSKGMVGPFVTLYMSLLDFSNLSVQGTYDKTQETTFGGITEFLLKGAISIALFIPLVALAFVLIVRVVILRGIIAFIPLGIVAYALFDKKEQDLGGGTGDRALGKITPGSILGLIFAPILPVFAISISIIILQTLQISMKDSISDNNKTWDFLGIKSKADEKDNNKICTDFRGLQTTCMNKGDAVGGGFTNFLPWLFVNIFAIGLMWMMVKTAIAGSSITSKIGNNIMKMGANALGSIPLLKIGGVGVGATSLSKAPSMISNNFDTIQRQRNAEGDKKLQELLDPSLKKDTGAFAIKDEVKEKLKTSIMSPTPNNKSLEAHFNDNLDEENKKIFNGLSPNERSNQIIKFLEESKISPEQNKISDLIENGYKSFINNTTQKIEDGKISEFITYINGTTIINAINKDNTLKGKIQKAGEGKIQFSNNKRTTVTPQ